MGGSGNMAAGYELYSASEEKRQSVLCLLFLTHAWKAYLKSAL